MLARIQADLFQAMKDKNTVKKNLLQIVRANVTNLAKEKRVDESKLENADIINVIVKEMKQQNDSLTAFQKGGRADLVEQTEASIKILSEYLPKQLTEDEIEDIIWDVLAQLGLKEPSIKDLGEIMKKLMPLTKGKADGQLVNSILMDFIK